MYSIGFVSELFDSSIVNFFLGSRQTYCTIWTWVSCDSFLDQLSVYIGLLNKKIITKQIFKLQKLRSVHDCANDGSSKKHLFLNPTFAETKSTVICLITQKRICGIQYSAISSTPFLERNFYWGIAEMTQSRKRRSSRLSQDFVTDHVHVSDCVVSESLFQVCCPR